MWIPSVRRHLLPLFSNTNLLTQIRRTLHELKNAEHGPAGVSQSVRAATNATPPAAGSGR